MLKKIILDYVESIDALRDFVDSIKLRLEEHANRVISAAEEPYLTERLERLQAVLGNMGKEKRNALLSKPLTEIEVNEEFKELLGFECTLQMKKDEKGKDFVEFGFPLNVLEASEPVQHVYFRTIVLPKNWTAI